LLIQQIALGEIHYIVRIRDFETRASIFTFV